MSLRTPFIPLFLAVASASLFLVGCDTALVDDEPELIEAILVDNLAADPPTSVDSETGRSVGTGEFRIDEEGDPAIAGGSGAGWYNYNPQTHAVTPIPGRTLVVRTADGRYAKVRILSYYKDAPEDVEGAESRYYTFEYGRPRGILRSGRDPGVLAVL